jgi:hypothetical protein
VKSEISVGCRHALRKAAFVEHRNALLRELRGRQRGETGLTAILGGEDRQHTVADQLEHVAAALVNRRNDRIEVVVKHRDHMLGGGIGDAGEAAQVAEPQHRVDAFGDAAGDPALEHAPAGVASQIGLNQIFCDAPERSGFHRECQKRHQVLQAEKVRVAKPAGRIGHPGRIDAIHVADDAIVREPIDDRRIVGHPGRAQFRKDRKFALALARKPAAQKRLTGFQQAVERTSAPAIVRDISVRATVIARRDLVLVAFPTKHAPFMNRMQRIDQHRGAGQRYARRNGALTESGNNDVSLSPANPASVTHAASLGSWISSMPAFYSTGL